MESNLEVEIHIRVSKEIETLIKKEVKKDPDRFPTVSQFVRSATFRYLNELRRRK